MFLVSEFVSFCGVSGDVVQRCCCGQCVVTCVFRVKKLMGRRWGAPNLNYLLAMGWPLLSCHV